MQASMPYYSIARATCHHYREIMSAQMQYTKQSRSISPYKSTLISSFCNQYAYNYVITFPITETLAAGQTRVSNKTLQRYNLLPKIVSFTTPPNQSSFAQQAAKSILFIIYNLQADILENIGRRGGNAPHHARRGRDHHCRGHRDRRDNGQCRRAEERPTLQPHGAACGPGLQGHRHRKRQKIIVT